MTLISLFANPPKIAPTSVDPLKYQWHVREAQRAGETGCEELYQVLVDALRSMGYPKEWAVQKPEEVKINRTYIQEG